ncbi:MAG: hypothetical protein HO273_00540 [Ferrovum myxofaciens]|uniref:hypothetical protein n=1 Tax=Ferrovum myxofaciens TaxID=416213 RepID=UPI001AF6CBBE|nr:hypothetical protein [Ferrovum myxofaciens]QKE37401.1 MAG: hypothetical protein HO273_00540 [Ferrovum myxofaciens]
MNTNTSIQAPYQAQPMDALTVHGVSIISRYNNPREIDEMTKFCELLVQRGLIDHIDSVFYDTGANLCSFQFKWKTLVETDAVAQDIKQAALETIYQFDWFGWAEHGKPCDDDTERMVAELETTQDSGLGKE